MIFTDTRMFRLKKIAVTGWIMLMLLCISGCAGYQFANPNKPPFHSIHINAATNQSYLQQGVAPLSDAIRKSFLSEGSVELRDSENAQAFLDVKITDYHRYVAAASARDTDRAQSFNVSVTVMCTLSSSSGKIYFENKPITVNQTVYADSGAQLSEFIGYPEFSATIANKIRDAVLNTW